MEVPVEIIWCAVTDNPMYRKYILEVADDASLLTVLKIIYQDNVSNPASGKKRYDDMPGLSTGDIVCILHRNFVVTPCTLPVGFREIKDRQVSEQLATPRYKRSVLASDFGRAFDVEQLVEPAMLCTADEHELNTMLDSDVPDASYGYIIQEAAKLVSKDGETPEYDRGICKLAAHLVIKAFRPIGVVKDEGIAQAVARRIDRYVSKGCLWVKKG